MKVVTRFAPSPTGFLHIGGIRTALFNYLYAKKNDGKFLLRIEDTDKNRSTKEATNAIFTGLEWLGIAHDNDVVFQSHKINAHKSAALKLLEENKAYYCFSTSKEIEIQKEKAISNKQHFIFHSPWRDAAPDTYPKGIKPVIRLKVPRKGQTIIHDLLQGDIRVENDHIDDMILLRSDGTPTYMLAVVVDDHDMEITHIIRGDDHLTNAARQIVLYDALGYKVPAMVHIPLIHGHDGAKLSKRHGALGVETYKEMGFLPDALCNYLLRLGWSCNDEEIISRKRAIELFSIDCLGKSPARLDMDKLRHLNSIYLRMMDNKELTKITISLLKQEGVKNIISNNIYNAMDSIKLRSEVILDLAKLAKLYLPDFKINIPSELQEQLKNSDSEIMSLLVEALDKLENFTKENIQIICKTLAEQKNLKIGKFMEPLRILLTGMINSPSLFELIEIIGKQTTLDRLKKFFA